MDGQRRAPEASQRRSLGPRQQEPALPPEGSPGALLKCAGSLTHEEAEEMRAIINEAHEREFEELWYEPH